MGAVRSPLKAQALLLLVGLAAGLLAAEGLVRALSLGQRRESYPPASPGARRGTPTNSRGYRDLERGPARPVGVRRALALGDSFTWGAGVEFDDAWPQRLERGLKRRRGETWEVVSLARRGMDTAEEARQLADEGLSYGPEVVILGYCLNDSEDAQGWERRRAGEWAQARAERQSGQAPPLAERSALYRFVRDRLWATLQNRRFVENFRAQYADDYPGWRAGRAALADMGARCRERRVPLLVAVFPLFGSPLDERYPFADLHEKVARAAREAGASVVDLLPVYRGVRWDLLVVDAENDEHPNEIAHRMAAQALLTALDEVVPGAGPVAAHGGAPPP